MIILLYLHYYFGVQIIDDRRLAIHKRVIIVGRILMLKSLSGVTRSSYRDRPFLLCNNASVEKGKSMYKV